MAVLEFLASGSVILTSSYHGVYWGTLLNRRVIAFPFSSKFSYFKHGVPLVTADDWKQQLKVARNYSNALIECRQANESFARDVVALLT